LSDFRAESDMTDSGSSSWAERFSHGCRRASKWTCPIDVEVQEYPEGAAHGFRLLVVGRPVAYLEK
jgi:hypothetical protein